MLSAKDQSREGRADPGGSLPTTLRKVTSLSLKNMQRQVTGQELYTKSHEILTNHLDFYKELGGGAPPTTPPPLLFPGNNLVAPPLSH